MTGRGPASEAEAPPTEGIPLPLRILWLRDEPESDLELIASIEARGATVARAHNLEEAIAQLQPTSVDVLVSDITRQGDPNAGFADLEPLRSEGLYEGPVIFYTLRITPSRRERARDLGAEMTSEPSRLLGRLEDLARALGQVAA